MFLDFDVVPGAGTISNTLADVLSQDKPLSKVPELERANSSENRSEMLAFFETLAEWDGYLAPFSKEVA